MKRKRPKNPLTPPATSPYAATKEAADQRNEAREALIALLIQPEPLGLLVEGAIGRMMAAGGTMADVRICYEWARRGDVL